MKAMATTTIKISGMHCGSCKSLIEDVAGDVPGVRSCDVDAGKGIGVVEHDEEFKINDLVKEIEALGDYKVTPL